MLYITGEKETLINLCKMENYSGSLEEYSRLFYKNNDHLRANQPLSRFTPILLSSSCKDQKELAREIHAFSESERNSLRQMQESGHDARYYGGTPTVWRKI